MSRPTCALRDRIAAYLADAFSGAKAENADAILAIVRVHATSDAAVGRACDRLARAGNLWGGDSMRAAILAALGGNDG